MSDSGYPMWLIDVITALPALEAHPQLLSDLDALRQRFPEPPVTPDLLAHVAECLLKTVEPMRAMNHLLHYLSVSASPVALWQQWQKHLETVTYTLTVFAASSFLSAMLCRYPDWLLWLIEEAISAPPPSPIDLAAELQALLDQGGQTEVEVAGTLRTFTHRHLVRIGAQDLNDLVDIETTTASLSALADTVVQAGLDYCLGELDAEYGRPTFADETGELRDCGFCVIGMGQSLVFFPEGTFGREPGLRPFRMGAFTIAAQAGVPIVPIALRGTRSVLRAQQWLPHPRPVHVTILAPIHPKGADWLDRVALREAVRAAILPHCGEPALETPADLGAFDREGPEAST